jgi:phospholipid-binding lipoprotein MlaA
MVSPGRLVFLLAALLCGCASTPTHQANAARDPWAPMNRAIYRFNDAIDRAALKPVAKGYQNVTPPWVRQGVGNFFTNLEQPKVIVNELLQGKPGPALMDTGRLVINTVFGLGGLFDLASANDMPLNDEDFGQTLAVWGIPSGPYLMLPFLGPSTLRDGPARGGDYFLNPTRYADLKTSEEIGLRAVDIIDMRARLLASEAALRDAQDPYAFIRNVWLQRREYQIHDGNVPLEDDEEEFMDEEPPAASASPPPR